MGKESAKPRNARKGRRQAIPHLLNLEGWYVTGASQLANYLRLDIEMENPEFPHFCSSVGERIVADDPYKNGFKTINIRDLPLHGKRIDLRAKRPSLRCRQCKHAGAAHAGLELGKDIHPRHRMTTRLVDYIRVQAATRTFTAVGEEIGIAEPTVRKIFKEYAPPKNQDMRIKAPRVLGIDDKHTGRRPLKTVFVNLEDGVLLDLYDENTADALQQFVHCLDNPRNIEVICIDMSGTYLSFCKKYIPWANVVIDKFHVLMKANSAVDAARIKVQKTLKDDKDQQRALSKIRLSFLRRKPFNEVTRDIRNYWIKRFPELGAVWDAKERFYGFYSQTSADEAAVYYDEWLTSLDKVTKSYFKELESCMGNHREEILNYFRVTGLGDKRSVTNGYLEGLNSQIQRILHHAPSYSFETLRQKLLQAYGPDREKKVEFRRTGLKEGGPRERIKPSVSKSKFDLKVVPKSSAQDVKDNRKIKTKSEINQVEMFFIEQTLPTLSPDPAKNQAEEAAGEFLELMADKHVKEPARRAWKKASPDVRTQSALKLPFKGGRSAAQAEAEPTVAPKATLGRRKAS